MATNQKTPWDPPETREEEDELPFVTLLAEARAALEEPGASVEQIKQKYRRAIRRGSAHLDAPSLDLVVDELMKGHVPDLPSGEYDDGPFVPPTFSEFVPRAQPKVAKARRPSRRPRPSPRPAPKASAIDRVLRLLGR
jgi:hypothetical protein